ncbi:MAG: sporulation peptidase YabG [Clostridia bacterium]|nr:sporulation peptidase YabG [Clostridia bacterium]
MHSYKIGDFVARKSYGGDIAFKIIDVLDKDRAKPRYVLKGLIYRIQADSEEDDLQVQDPRKIYMDVRRYYSGVHNRSQIRGVNFMSLLTRLRSRPGRILHIDADESFLNKCLNHYREAKLNPFGMVSDESRQPGVVRGALERYRPDILVLTGHDGLKKESGNLNSIDNYTNSRYFIQAVKEARNYQPDLDKLCIFAGACQSYFEGIMGAGANFASSPGRVLINALDPAFVSEKVALTETTKYVTPREVAAITISGSDGIGGINTRGHLKMI